MGVMLYKQGRGTKVWGKEVQAKVVDDGDVEDHLADGWVKHPNEVPETNDEPIVDSGVVKKDMGEVSDGYHTFNELYAHRVRLFSTLMNAFRESAWWSFQHHDGEQWDGWVLAGIDTPEGAVTYHLPESEIEHLPKGTEIEFGKEWDGHTADDVLNRLLSLRPKEPATKERKKPGPKPKAESDADKD